MKTLATITKNVLNQSTGLKRKVSSTKQAKEILEGIAYEYLKLAKQSKVIQRELDEVESKRRELGKVLTDTSKLANAKVITTDSLVITRVDSHSATIKKALLIANGVCPFVIENSTEKKSYSYPRVTPVAN